MVKVNANAFSLVKTYSAELSTLIIEAGGNPEFELAGGKNALADVNGTLDDIVIQGSCMTTANIARLLEGLDRSEGSGELRIDLYDDSYALDGSIAATENITRNTLNTKVVLPAARVGTQTFGSAGVYGRFMLDSEVATFCGSQLFQDTDDGSNLLFYIPTEVVERGGEKKIHIQRVRYILPGQGVLRHKTAGSSSYVILPRVDADEIDDFRYDSDETLYGGNMLVGTLAPTAITATAEKGGTVYTNMVLYNGSFYPTSGGTLGANRAYLQVAQTDVGGLAKLSMVADDDGDPSAIVSPMSSQGAGHVWYTVSGQPLEGEPRQPGIYVNKESGRKEIRR